MTRLRFFTISLAVAAVILLSSAANAATIWNEEGECDVPSSAPAGTVCHVIHISGPIEKGDDIRFTDLILTKKIRWAIVELNSIGGYLLSGISVGVIINTMGYSTYVPDNTVCASVCAAMWVSGKTRYASSSGKIGFHQSYLKDRRGRMFYDPATNKQLKLYYQKVGMSRMAADFMVAADPRDMYWLNSDLAKGYGIVYTTHDKKKEDKSPVTATVVPVAKIPKAVVDRLKKLD